MKRYGTASNYDPTIEEKPDGDFVYFDDVKDFLSKAFYHDIASVLENEVRESLPSFHRGFINKAFNRFIERMQKGYQMSKIKDPLPGIEGLMPGVKDGGLTIVNLKDEPVKRKPQFKLAIVTSVRLTEEEWSSLVAKADQQEVKPSALIRQCVKVQIGI